MSDDLVKRLRCYADLNDAIFNPWVYGEAADRIEKDARHIDEMYGLVAAMNAEHITNKTRIEQLEAANLKAALIKLDDMARIEKLEAALRDIIDERGICGNCGQLATGEGKRSFVICDKTVLGFKGPCHWTPQDPKDIARKALEGKDD